LPYDPSLVLVVDVRTVERVADAKTGPDLKPYGWTVLPVFGVEESSSGAKLVRDPCYTPARVHVGSVLGADPARYVWLCSSFSSVAIRRYGLLSAAAVRRSGPPRSAAAHAEGGADRRAGRRAEGRDPPPAQRAERLPPFGARQRVRAADRRAARVVSAAS